ncbi:sterol-sensing domain of SREBP cleavage-activation-domain-containing protein [Powellomyces hirtus]|nr:sterol-sensing domain of SREBP cleavage-activation-domain-containing protein [Powellomyces hirtus]
MDRMNALLRPDGWDRRVKSLNRMLSDIFYRHGLFCASHPYVALFLSFVLLFFLSSPIVHQLHANLTQTAQAKPMLFWETTSSHAHIHMGGTHAKYGKAPFLRLEQIVINVTNSDDDESPVQGAVGRKLLQYALDLQQKISVSVAEFENASENAKAPALRQYKLSDICYKPHGSDKCLVHSPLEFWASDEARFNADTDYLGTLSNTSVLSSLGIPIPLQSVFGGIQLDSATGYVIGAESLLITYFLNERNTDLTYEETISDIWDKLWEHVLMGHRQAVPTHGLPDPLAWRAEGEPKLLYYEFGRSSSVFTGESLVLGVMYLIVFLYISLVLGKVDLVKSKFALGFGAVVTVFSGLIMSVGLCSMLGVKTSLVPWYVFACPLSCLLLISELYICIREALPFLIIVVGVENISVLTNAVVMTSLDLPVKERVGLGLSKVGASMTLSLGGEMVLLLIASTTSIPALQEFCLFAAVSIVMDYFMQITFFITILSIDIRRLEVTIPNRSILRHHLIC